MLTENDIHVGVKVSHHKFGAGEIVDILDTDDGGRLQINFSGKPGHSMSRKMAIDKLKLVSEDKPRILEGGLQDSLSQNRETVLRWVEEAPLYLVAVSLIDMDKKTKVTPLKEKLTSSVVEPSQWDEWWNKVRPALRESRNFKYNSGNIRLIGKPSDIDTIGLDELSTLYRSKSTSKTSSKKTSTPATRLAEWIVWICSDKENDTPKLAPPDGFRAILQELPESLIPIATDRLLRGTETRIIDSNKPPSATSRVWLDSLSDVLSRWTETNTVMDHVVLTRVITLLAHALDKLNEGEHESVLVCLGNYMSGDANRLKDVVHAFLIASHKLPHHIGMERLLQNMRQKLDTPTVVQLWRLMIESNINTASEFRAWRSLDTAQKADVFMSLLTNADGHEMISNIGDLLQREWRLSISDDRYHLFKAVMLAWLIHEQLMPCARDMLEETLNGDFDEFVSEGSHIAEWKDMSRVISRDEVARLRVETDQCIETLRSKRREAENEADIAKRQARYFQGELKNASRIAVLDITRDAVLVLGEVLQELRASPHPSSRKVEDACAGVTLALAALGVEPFGEVGNIISFDAKLYEADQPIPANQPVEVIAPGIRFTRGMDSPLIMLRAQVRIKDAE